MCDCKREFNSWVDVEDEIVAQMGRDEADEFRADAERYRFIRDTAALALYIERDDHKTYYNTAAESIAENPDLFSDVDPAEIERMKAADTIWRLMVYPTTPIGSVTWHGATLDTVIDAAMAEG